MSTPTTRVSSIRRRLLSASLGLALVLSACGSGDSGDSTNDSAGGSTEQTSGDSTGASTAGSTAEGGSGSGGTDDGTELTMWVRSSTDEYSQRLVDAYNASHKNQVTLTVLPNDQYQQKVGTAAGSNSLPDLLASDVVYAPNYVKQGLYVDITDRIASLDVGGSLVKAHTSAASADGKTYAVPHKVDSSLIFYNKDLYKEAGLDPEKPPTNFTEIYEQAKAIRALGGDKYGFYFGGNCPGCNAYTAFPYAAAAGTPPLSDDGKTADIDNEAFKAAFELYGKMFDEDIVAPAAKTEDGSTWTASFIAGNVGIFPAGSFVFPDALANAKFDWGVTPLMSPDGSKTSTFIGGDVLGVSNSSKKVEQAWDFVAWSLSDDAQVEVVAKNGDLPVRTDLADNQYSAADPRISATVANMVNGYTPIALPYGAIFNDPTGPWLIALRDVVFNKNADALAEAQKTIQSELDAS